MPRDKQFDVDEALDRALETFWAQGYEATSMDDLLKQMEINRGSFYDTFKSKHDVLIDSLKRYDREYRRADLRASAEKHGPRGAILTLFKSMAEGNRGPHGRHGCFLVNTALELAPRDEQVAKIVRAGFRDTEKFFASLLEQGQSSGEISNDLNPQETARALMCQLLGLMVLVRSGTGKSVLRSAANLAEELLT